MRRFKFSPIAITIFIRILMKKSSTIYKKLSCFCCEFIHQSVKLTQSTRVYIENEDNNLILFGCHLCCLGICVSYFPFYFSAFTQKQIGISDFSSKMCHFRQHKPQFSDDQKFYFVEYANRLTGKSEEELK